MTDEFTTAAKNEAARSYSGDWDPGEVPVDDWGMSEAQRDAFRAGAEWARDHLAAQEPTGAERDVWERDETIKEQRAKIEDLRKAVWERGETIGDLREDLASAEARIPSTSEEALALAWELACPVPEGQMIPAGTPLIERWSGGDTAVAPAGRDVDLPATVSYVERRTLAPLPTPRPRHAEVIERELDVCIGGDGNEDLADTIARAIEEQEGQDDE